MSFTLFLQTPFVFVRLFVYFLGKRTPLVTQMLPLCSPPPPLSSHALLTLFFRRDATLSSSVVIPEYLDSPPPLPVRCSLATSSLTFVVSRDPPPPAYIHPLVLRRNEERLLDPWFQFLAVWTYQHHHRH